MPPEGYARVIDAPTGAPLTSITLSSWINVTAYPNGVTPIFTYLAPDASSQISFFLRPDSIGVLWGGPTPVPIVREHHVDRHPRLLWPFINDDALTQSTRIKRDAVDYSGGLGDIENILAVGRQGRANENWSPLSFVDVGEMGVADLDTSASSHIHESSLHILPTRTSGSRAQSYNDWTNVPYELTMLESGRHDQHFPQSPPQPRIITEPSGDHGDFVYFNWDAPPGPNKKNQFISNNQWSPLWDPTRKPEGNDQILQPTQHIPNQKQIPVQKEQSLLSTSQTKIKDKNLNRGKGSGHWSSDIIPVQLLNGGWGPITLNPAFTRKQTPSEASSTTASTDTTTTTSTTPTTTKKPFFTFTTRPSVQLTNKPTATAQEPKSPQIILSKPQNIRSKVITERFKSLTRRPPVKPFNEPTIQPKIKTTRPYFRPRTSLKLRGRLTSPVPTLQSNQEEETEELSTAKEHTTTTTTTTTKATTTSIPRSRIVPNHPRFTTKRYKAKPTTTRSTTPAPSTTRKPLWMLINRPGFPTRPKSNAHKTTMHTTTITPKKISSGLPRTAPPRLTTKKTKPTTTTTIIPKTNLSTSLKPSTKQILARNSQATTNPHISSSKSKVSIWTGNSSRLKPTKPTSQNNKKSIKGTNASLINRVIKHEPIYTGMESEHIEEFKRAMEPVPSVENGDTSVVYSVPITNEEAFYKMYEQYQKKVIEEIKPDIVLDELYKEVAVKGDHKSQPPHEDETNENDLNIQESSEDIIYYKDSTPINHIAETQADAFVEEIAAVYPTEQPLKPTKPRNDILVQEETNEDQITNIKVTTGHPKLTTKSSSRGNDNVNDSNIEDLKITTDDERNEVDTTAEVNEESNQENKIIYEPIIEEEILYNNEKNYYITPEEEISLADLYKPSTDLNEDEPIPLPSNYQESVQLYHEQLPPSYIKPSKDDIIITKNTNINKNQYQQTTKFSKPEVDIVESVAYQEEIINSEEDNQSEEELLELVFSSDPQELIAQGFLPKPIHTVNTQKEADEWMTEQYKHQNTYINSQKPLIQAKHPEKTTPIIKPSQPLGPIVQHPSLRYTQNEKQSIIIPETIEQDEIPENSKEQFLEPETLKDVSESSLNVNFRKMPYNFNLGQLYHIAFSWSALDHELNIYINGRLAGTLIDVMPKSEELPPEGLVILGRTLLPDLTDFDPTSLLIGELAGVNMWSEKLSSEEIKNIYECSSLSRAKKVLTWQSTTMKFYKGAHLVPSQSICGAP